MQSRMGSVLMTAAHALMVVCVVRLPCFGASAVDNSPSPPAAELWVPAEEGALAIAVQHAASITGPVTLNLQAGRHRLRAPLKLTTYVCALQTVKLSLLSHGPQAC